jgi:hypothetical protein
MGAGPYFASRFESPQIAVIGNLLRGRSYSTPRHRGASGHIRFHQALPKLIANNFFAVQTDGGTLRIREGVKPVVNEVRNLPIEQVQAQLRAQLSKQSQPPRGTRFGAEHAAAIDKLRALDA